MAAHLRGRGPRQGLAVSARLIATHVGSAVLLVLGTNLLLEVRFGVRPADFPALRSASYAGVMLPGLFFVVRAAWRSLDDWAPGDDKTIDHLPPHLAGLALLAGQAAPAPAPLRPDVAEAMGGAVDGWWERHERIADAVHALYFGVPTPKRAAERQAFEGLQRSLLAAAERSRAAASGPFAEGCRSFLHRLRTESSRPLSATAVAYAARGP